MKSLTLQQKIITGVAIAIALSIGAWFIHRDGVQKGAVDQKLEANSVATKQIRVVAVVAQKAADAQVKKSVAVRIPYHAAREKIVVKGDSVFVDGQSIESPSLAGFVNVADNRAAQDSTTIQVAAIDNSAAKDSLVSSLDARVDLLQEIKKPRIGVKTGVAIGVVGTATVVYVSIRIIRALAGK